MKNNRTMKPMGLIQSFFYFGIPSVVFYVSMYYIVPQAVSRGGNLAYTHMLTLTVILSLMLIAALVAYRKEGNQWDMKNFLERFRLTRPSLKIVLITVVSTIAIFILLVLLAPTAEYLSKIPFFEPPSYARNISQVGHSGMMTDFMGEKLKGNWRLFFTFSVMLLVNIIGEEFWWRGYILPRQEMAFGKNVWIVHGIMWALFHFFSKWMMIVYLFQCTAMTLLAYRTKNTWSTIISHLILNSMGVLPILIGVLA